MKTSLVIMAAGLGSRYGGDKQIDGVGPNNEILLEYAVHDALRAGFEKIVFIIKPDMESLMERLCYLRHKKTLDGTPVEVVYVLQDFTSLPGFYSVPAERTKPFGTVHALLCAADVVKEPCCVINADDYYGVNAYRVIRDALAKLPANGRAAMVGYLLKNTASLHGAVSRGLCVMDGGKLQAIQETKNIQMYPDSSLRDLTADRPLNPDTVVSMNFWGFMPSIFPVMQAYFEDFLRGEGGRDLKSECLLPVMADHLMRSGQLEISVLHSADRWFGMTYQQDRAIVSGELKLLHEQGVYPKTLRE